MELVIYVKNETDKTIYELCFDSTNLSENTGGKLMEERLNQLESKLQTLLQSWEQGNYPQGIQPGARVTGAMELPKILNTQISESQLIDIYHQSPQILNCVGIKVGLTPESYERKAEATIYFEKAENGNYWIITSLPDTYWLIPRNDIRINAQSVQTVQSLFQCQSYQGSKTKDFWLVKPAGVSWNPNSQQWKLEELGALDFAKAPASRLEIELQRLQGGEQKFQSRLQQLEEEVQSLREELTTANQERKSLLFQIEQLTQMVNGQPLEKPEIQSVRMPSMSDYWSEIKLSKTLEKHTASVRCLAIHKNQLASGGFDNSIHLWNLDEDKWVEEFKESAIVNSLFFNPVDDFMLLGGTNNNYISLWKQGRNSVLEGHTERVLALTISPDGKTLVSGSRDHTFRVWDLMAKKCNYTLDKDFGTIVDLAITPNGETLISSHGDFSLRAWNLKSPNSENSLLEKVDSLIWAIAISPDGKTLAAGCLDGKIMTINIQTREIVTQEAHKHDIYALAFSPDGQILASGGSDKIIRLWKIEGLKLIEVCSFPEAHSEEIYDLVFSPDGQRLISCSRDKTIKIWIANKEGKSRFDIFQYLNNPFQKSK